MIGRFSRTLCSQTADSRSILSSLTVASQYGLREMGISKLTPVQEQTFPTIINGHDVLAKARTGTGKTVGFLLPVIERLAYSKASKSGISVLIVSPSRELANQIKTEGQTLLKHHKLKIGSIVGGTSTAHDVKLFNTPLNILVCTPGRFLDHAANTPILKHKLKHTSTLILDEADQLLDMGFEKEIKKISTCLPTARQTILFSATVPKKLIKVCDSYVMQQDYEFISTVSEEEEQTNMQVKQSAIVCPASSHLAVLDRVIEEHKQANVDYKVIVFLPTARMAGYCAELFSAAGKSKNYIEMHSRKSQAHRSKQSAIFDKGQNLVMFSSDVSARGMDYAGVTLVVQLGIVSSAEQYIHRLGRTARAGKKGEGVIILSETEETFMEKLSNLPVELVDQTETKRIVKLGMRPALYKALDSVQRHSGLKLAAERAYSAFIGFYKGNVKTLDWTTDTLVKNANAFSMTLGLRSPPALESRLVGKMGLRGHPMIKISSQAPKSTSRRRNYSL